MFRQRVLMLTEHVVRGKNGFAARGGCGMMPPAQVGDVLDRLNQPGKALMILRSGLPAIGQLLGRGAELVRAQPLQLFALAVEDAQVRAEKLVAGAGQEVAVQRPHVNGPVRCVMNGIDECHRAGCVRQSHYFVYIVDRSHRVGCPADSDQPGVAPNLGRRSNMSSVQSDGLMSAVRTFTPRSSRQTQGDTLASWSRTSPAIHRRSSTRGRWRG